VKALTDTFMFVSAIYGNVFNNKIKPVINISPIKLPFDLKEIKPGAFAYLTKRKLTNKAGDESGEIILWKRKEAEESEYVLRCPFCMIEQEGRVILQRRPYRVRCSSCDRSITLPKLQNQAKKERKQG
jgi:hypothetical protein